MELAELEKLVEELETRVERLRGLYDQYFMGIERIEPLVLRRDVDRRLWTLWREQIRNTGLRFRLHMTIQRYNTYQQYWQRICREIESGTYQRDLRRAIARFGDAALTTSSKRRKKMYEKGLAKQIERKAARRKAAEELGLAEPETDEQAAAAPEPEPESVAEPAAAAEPAPQIGSSRPAPARPVIGRPVAPRRPAARRGAAEPFQPLELDMLSDFIGEESSLRPQPLPSFEPQAGEPEPGPGPVDRPSGDALSTQQPAPAARPPAVPPPDEDELDAPTLPPPSKREGPPSRGKQLPAARAIGTSPQPPFSSPRPAPQAAQPAAPASAPGFADDELPTSRLRQIYGQYVDAKRRCNESTASLTFEKIAKDLRDTAQRLREKHAGKKVDFEIVVKQGTPVLRPVIKG